MSLRVDSFIEKHICIFTLLFIASETLIFEIVIDIPFGDPPIIELQPPLANFDEGVVMTALG